MYFALEPTYSASDIYSVPSANTGFKYMYYASVLVGDFIKGQSGIKVPPNKPGQNNPYDSVTNDEANPTMFIIFYDNQAYPRYLIEFK